MIERRARGFVHDAAKAHFANDFRGRKAYLCGPPIEIEACITTLMQGRLFDIYTESHFGGRCQPKKRSPLFKGFKGHAPCCSMSAPSSRFTWQNQ